VRIGERIADLGGELVGDRDTRWRVGGELVQLDV
jgi:hypothetical protein